MTLFRNTNSWHWLVFALLGSAALAAYLCLVVFDRYTMSKRPDWDRMDSKTAELLALEESTAIQLEAQVVRLEDKITDFEAMVVAKVGDPVPEGEAWVLALGNSINRALLENQLRIIAEEQIEVEVQPPAARRQPARSADATPPEPDLPYNMREIRYLVEGEYRHMFMFLVKQSHKKPSYHFKDISITPTVDNRGMQMEFTVQIYFT